MDCVFFRHHFSSSLKRMSVVAGYTNPGTSDTYHFAAVKGAPEVLKPMFESVPQGETKIVQLFNLTDWLTPWAAVFRIRRDLLEHYKAGSSGSGTGVQESRSVDPPASIRFYQVGVISSRLGAVWENVTQNAVPRRSCDWLVNMKTSLSKTTS